MVEPQIETHATTMGEGQTTTWGTCTEWRPSPARRDRRNSGRVQSTGTAVLHGALAARGRILDLAIGGVSLLIDLAASFPDVGALVQLDVRLDGAGCWLHLSGSVARVEAHGSGAVLAIELLVVPSGFEDVVQEELLSALECTQVPRVLLVDGARGRRELVAAAFRAIGYHVIEVSSPLEAIVEIDQSRLHLWAVVIADTKLASHADDLRAFLNETHPEVPLIDVGQRTCRGGRASLTVDEIPDLARQVGKLAGIPEQPGGTR